MSRIPALGPRGEGWVGLQLAAIVLVVVAGRLGTPVAVGDASLQPVAALVGNVLVVAGLLLIIAAAAVLRIGEAFTVFPRPVATGHLLETGPFRVVRHPVYSGLVLSAVGAVLVRPSLVAVAAGGLLFVVLDLKRRREEAWLGERYAGYARYRTRTKALIPWVY